VSGAGESVFLFDVDNTLLDNDRIEADIGAHVEGQFGSSGCERFWSNNEELRA
jgi:FMN phosphatase YigB (HAD superfamily)